MARKYYKYKAPKPQTTAANYDYLAARAERMFVLQTAAQRLMREQMGSREKKYVITADDGAMVYETDGRRGRFVEHDLPRITFSRKDAETHAEQIMLRSPMRASVTRLFDYAATLANYATRELQEVEKMQAHYKTTEQ